MKTKMVDSYTQMQVVDDLNSAIHCLEKAIKICSEVDSSDQDLEKSYPYAAGYARAAMQDVLQRVNTIKASLSTM